jgi:hypothetical protein
LFETQHSVKWNPLLPSGTFEIRLCRKVFHVPETEVGHWDYLGWDMQHVLQCSLVENTYPADANPFGASREPGILDGADCGIHGSFRHGVATESMSAFTFRIADDAEVLGRFKNAFEF